ncbi:hypothetical protein V6N11_013053 [Hibiscus sabdariffa]|uniref:Uncharacterized protein n=2 Tax=Hibiscus sabdariffa TaxID=183260 RepID=A0ABR2A0Z2_9ROSI
MAQSVNKNAKVWKVKGVSTNVEVGEPSNSLPDEQQHLGDPLQVSVVVEHQQISIEVVSSHVKVPDVIRDSVCQSPAVDPPLEATAEKNLDDVEFHPLVSSVSQEIKAQVKGAKKGFATSSRTVIVLNGGEQVIGITHRLAS